MPRLWLMLSWWQPIRQPEPQQQSTSSLSKKKPLLTAATTAHPATSAAKTNTHAKKRNAHGQPKTNTNSPEGPHNHENRQTPPRPHHTTRNLRPRLPGNRPQHHTRQSPNMPRPRRL